MCVFVCLYIINKYIYMCVRACVRACVLACVCVCDYACSLAHLLACRPSFSRNPHFCVCSCMCIYMCVRACARVCMWLCLLTCAYASMQALFFSQSLLIRAWARASSQPLYTHAFSQTCMQMRLPSALPDSCIPFLCICLYTSLRMYSAAFQFHERPPHVCFGVQLHANTMSVHHVCVFVFNCIQTTSVHL